MIGGRGFVGAAMAGHARERGFEVTAVGKDDYPTIVGRRFDVVVFAAGNARRYLVERDRAWDLDANVGAVYRALADVRAGHFVFISSVDVYADPSRVEATREDAPIDLAALSTYGLHKRLAEIVVMREARRWLIVRLGQMVGPGLRKGPVFDALRGDPLRVSTQSQYPFLRTASAAAITFALLEGGAEQTIFNVCGRGSVGLGEVLPRVPRVLAGAPVERYAIDVSAAARRVSLPASKDEICKFLESAA